MGAGATKRLNEVASGSAEGRGGWRPQALQDRQVDRASRSLLLPGCPPRAPTGGTERARLAKEKSRWWQVSAQHAAEGVRAGEGHSAPFSGQAPPTSPGSRQPPAFSQRGAPTPQRERRAAWLLFSVMVVVSI